mmetsp:Transcript_59534/g.121965  ORF Transcript_59534/g.121965 Transcript_59534/m.121965 type:complete len:264 (-) Transcript_59534:872-1663(-)
MYGEADGTDDTQDGKKAVEEVQRHKHPHQNRPRGEEEDPVGVWGEFEAESHHDQEEEVHDPEEGVLSGEEEAGEGRGGHLRAADEGADVAGGGVAGGLLDVGFDVEQVARQHHPRARPQHVRNEHLAQFVCGVVDAEQDQRKSSRRQHTRFDLLPNVRLHRPLPPVPLRLQTPLSPPQSDGVDERGLGEEEEEGEGDGGGDEACAGGEVHPPVLRVHVLPYHPEVPAVMLAVLASNGRRNRLQVAHPAGGEVGVGNTLVVQPT